MRCSQHNFTTAMFVVSTQDLEEYWQCITQVKKKKHGHVTPILKSLHWLPVSFRIKFKVLLITHKCLQGKAPQYLSSRLEKYVPGRSLRSSDLHLLVVPRTVQKTYGDRAFSVIAPRLWNGLPLDIRICDEVDAFKSKLKTFLFRKAFDCWLRS